MPKLQWPTEDEDAQRTARVVVVPRTPDYDHPYTQRVPTPPPINATRAARKVTVAPTPSVRANRSNPITLGLVLSIGAVIIFCWGAYYVMSGDSNASTQQSKVSNSNLASIPEIVMEETPDDFVKSMDISSVRLASDKSRASINGTVYRVGDMVDEHYGLVFVGHDPDGEFLLFRDANQQVYFYSLYKAQ